MDHSRQIDVTELIAEGNVSKITNILAGLLQIGYDRLYWDGYDSAIYLYQSSSMETNDQKTN